MHTGQYCSVIHRTHIPCGLVVTWCGGTDRAYGLACDARYWPSVWYAVSAYARGMRCPVLT
eukprot:3354004-Rhodomonas_salina.2